MKVSRGDEQVFVFKKEIHFDFDGSDEYITLRELNTDEANQLASAGKIDRDGQPTDVMAMKRKTEELFPKCVVDSSLEWDDGAKMTGQEVYNNLKKSNRLFQEVLHKWIYGDEKEADTPFASQTQNEGN